MKRMLKTITSVFLGAAVSVALLAEAPMVCASEPATVTLSFSGTTDFYGRRDILDEYACSDGRTVRIVNGRNVYRYDSRADSYTLEYSFPEQEAYNANAGQSGTLHVLSDVKSAYINRDTGKLYFAQDKYYDFNKLAGMTVQVFTYDLNAGRLLSSFEVNGENIESVGADNSGNVYLAVRRQFDDMSNTTGLRVFSAAGVKLASADTANSVDSISGFSSGGVFFTAEVERVAIGGGSYSVNRYLRRCTFNGSKVTVGSSVITKLSYRYNRPVELAGNGQVALYDGEIFDAASGEQAYRFDIGASVDNDYCAAHNGVNVKYIDGKAYVLTGADKIKCYSLSNFSLLSTYYAEGSIFNFIPGNNGLIVLLKNGSKYRISSVGFNAFVPVQAKSINLNSLAVYQRSQAEIVTKFSEMMPQNYGAAFFKTAGSAVAPYAEYTLTAATKENIVRAANYFRWLEGLSGFSSASDLTWSNAAKGAVLTQRNVELTGRLSHYPSRPADMDEDFYAAGWQATSTSNIAYGFGTGQYAIPNLLRGFLNDEGYTDIPGHRDMFFTRNGYLFAAGYSPMGSVNTIQYAGTPNPEGRSTIGNNEPAYAWPAPGLFPEEEIAIGSLWTVNLNYEYVKLSSGTPSVTITDLQTGEQFVRDTAATGVHTADSWGRFISFAPPETPTYSGKSYKVTVTNLLSADDAPMTLEYTVDFFSYSDEIEMGGDTYTCDSYGRLSEVVPPYMLGDVDCDGRVTVSDVTLICRYTAEYMDFDNVQLLAGDVNGSGTVTVADATIIQRYLAEYIDNFDDV